MQKDLEDRIGGRIRLAQQDQCNVLLLTCGNQNSSYTGTQQRAAVTGGGKGEGTEAGWAAVSKLWSDGKVMFQCSTAWEDAYSLQKLLMHLKRTRRGEFKYSKHKEMMTFRRRKR